MEINIIEEKKNRLVFDVKGMTHTFSNILKEELWNNDKVKIASYAVKHPLIGIPKFIVETDGSEPRKVLSDAAQKLKKKFERFEKDVKKEVR